MKSISKNEFNVVSFLIRNFSKRYTIRNIASELKISAAGAHAALKKLESGGIVKAEKLGTGLFYEVDLDSKVARHLAAIVLLEHFDVKKIKIDEIEKESRAAIFDGKNLVVIASNLDLVKDVCYRELREIKLICKIEAEFIDALRNKDRGILEVLKRGNVLFGEELVIDAIKRVG